jgi:hypothetical protein
MKVSELGVIEINEGPPRLDLRPAEAAALADELVHYRAAFAGHCQVNRPCRWGLDARPG